jgi:hypothetical protein
MARKRFALKGLDYNSKEYWNKLLTEEGLSMDRGKSSKLLYIGASSDVELVEGLNRTNDGRFKPQGWGPGSAD